MQVIRIVTLFLVFTSHALLGHYKLGLENISPQLIASLKNKRIGLVTNQTGKDQYGNRNVDILLGHGLTVTHLFAPEHGIDGIVQAGVSVHDAKDAKTGLPIVSMYKQGGDNTLKGKQVDTELLSFLDVFIFDMQDAGMRHYTYVSTLYKLLEVAALYQKPVIVLDRPNPLGGVMEAPLVDPVLKSFIGIAPIPVRHGMTFGELAHYFNNEYFRGKVTVTVVPMLDYKRSALVTEILAPLSPNISSLNSLRGYSFLGLLSEVGPFDIGIGSKEAFYIIGIPKSMKFDHKKFDELRTVLKEQHVESCWHSYYSERKKDSYVGLRIKISDPNKVSTLSTLLAVLDFFRKEGVKLTFRNFDKAIGTTLVREYLEDKIDRKRLMQALKRDTQAFYFTAKPFFLYDPAPHWLL